MPINNSEGYSIEVNEDPASEDRNVEGSPGEQTEPDIPLNLSPIEIEKAEKLIRKIVNKIIADYETLDFCSEDLIQAGWIGWLEAKQKKKRPYQLIRKYVWEELFRQAFSDEQFPKSKKGYMLTIINQAIKDWQKTNQASLSVKEIFQVLDKETKWEESFSILALILFESIDDASLRTVSANEHTEEEVLKLIIYQWIKNFIEQLALNYSSEQRGEFADLFEDFKKGARLTNRDIKIIILRYWEQLSYEDIGGQIGVSRERIRTLLYSIHRKIRHALRIWYQDFSSNEQMSEEEIDQLLKLLIL